MLAAGSAGILIAAAIALLAKEARLRRTAALASAIVLASLIQFGLLLLRIRPSLPYRALWAFVALVSAGLLISYVIDRRLSSRGHR